LHLLTVWLASKSTFSTSAFPDSSRAARFALGIQIGEKIESWREYPQQKAFLRVVCMSVHYTRLSFLLTFSLFSFFPSIFLSSVLPASIFTLFSPFFLSFCLPFHVFPHFSFLPAFIFPFLSISQPISSLLCPSIFVCPLVFLISALDGSECPAPPSGNFTPAAH